ncbi:MAG: TIGR03905 family TSCPD domain-containing protein [Muribaculaceae bacterium]|nr:TIGR03905 family TSCPD domain-containing protein [Muribaculaceae bacterium]
MKYTYQTKGTCSREIEILTRENDGREIIEDVRFLGGCSGNLQGIGALVKGMTIEEVISRLEGIDCKGKGTSCPDQLAKALKEMKA